MTNFVPDGSAIEQPIERRYDPQRGWQTVRRWRGNQTSIEAKALELVNAGFAVVVREGAVWEVEGTIGGESSGGGTIDTPVDLWELTGNAVEKDLLQADIAAVANLNESDYRLLRDIFDGKIDAEKYRTSSPPFVAPASGDPVGLWQLYLAGTKAVTIYQQVLRHTKTVAFGFEFGASIVGVGQVHTTAKLLQITAIPGYIEATMPTSSNVTKPGSVNEFTYGWLKTFPQITVGAYSKSHIIQEWQWGLWAQTLYTINS